MYLRHLEKLTARKDGGTDEGGVLVTKEKMADADASKVDANEKADASEASDAWNIDTPKINVKRGTRKTCAITIVIS